MTTFSDRAERIAERLVGHETGAAVVAHDINARQGVVDFLLHWPDGTTGALEVTLIVENASIAWQGMAATEGWRWPASSSWDFRPNEINFHYKSTRKLVLRAVELCDFWSVDDPKELPSDVLEVEPNLRKFTPDGIGSLYRMPFSPGVGVYQSVRAEFVEAAPSDFSRVIETWHEQPHLAPHIDKLLRTPKVSERHLFLVPMDDVLPARFFTDDFALPSTPPAGFEALDVLWIWSNYWHRYLRYQDREWSWVDFLPHESVKTDGTGTTASP